MWFEKSVFYQIYPLGFCGAPKENDSIPVPRIQKVTEWIPHLKRLNVDAVYLSPVFESDRHGYDTRDYCSLDCRLGTNGDFADVCKTLRENGIKIVLDGVFNHTGRGFWAFRDVQQKREQSDYKDWFYINWSGNSCYNDGFEYEGWEGHFELVKLNLQNPSVVDYLFSAIRMWVEEFGIDGLRLDVAYCLDTEFMKKLRNFCNTIKNDFLLLGEVLFGDYNRIVNSEMLHSCTNYECYKGLYSSFNDMNLFEIDYSLNRQFSDVSHSIYKGKHLLCFVDNHDVTRVSSILHNKNHLPLIYGLLFSMPGIPCIYYGSEWGIDGAKQNGNDDLLRPDLPFPVWNELTDLISMLASIHKESKALLYGGYKTVFLTNRQLIFERAFDDERVWVGINADGFEYTVYFQEQVGTCTDMFNNQMVFVNGSYTLPPNSLFYWKLDTLL